MNPDDLRRALGGIVVEASYMERVLRSAFTALMGSKYAPVADGHLTTHNLIETCERISEVHTDLSAEARAGMKAALKACNAGNTRRNRVIHDAWVQRPDGIFATLRTLRTTSDVQVTAQTLPELDQLADDLGHAADELAAAIIAAFGPEGMHVEDQLRQELGRDITPGSGR